jgi:hypothetical protein
MAFCKMVDLLYSAIPLRPFRDFLIRRHMEACPLCQARLASRAEARGLFVAPEAAGNAEGLWSRISSRIGPATEFPDPKPAPAGAGWRWAAAAATAAVVAVTGFWLLREVERPGFGPYSIAAADRFQIDYVKVGGAPAQTFVYQPQGTDTVFVWAVKNP